MRDGLLLHGRLAIRVFRRAPLYVVGAVVPLASGIGGTIGVVSLVEHVLVGREPWRDPETLMLLARRQRGAGSDGTELTWSYPSIRAMQQAPHRAIATVEPVGFAKVVAADPRSGATQRVRAELVSGRYFRTLGVAAQLGRLDIGESPDAFKAIVSDRLWRQSFRGDSGIVGRAIIVNGEWVTVAGVAPAAFEGVTGSADVWLPISLAPPLTGIAQILGDQYWGYVAALRLRPAIPAVLRAAELRHLARNLGLGAASGRLDLAFVTPRQATVQGTLRRALVLLLAAAVCALLLVCANVAALAAVRALSLRDDIRIQVALGATRTQVIVRFVGEGVLIAGVSVVAGLLFSRWVMDALWAARPVAGVWVGVLAHLSEPSIGGRALASSLVILVIVVVLIAWWPGMEAHLRSNDAVAPGGAAAPATAPARSRVRMALVAVQVALAFVLAHAALLLLSSVDAIGRDPFGVRRDGVVTARVQLPRAQFGRAEAAVFYDALLPRLRAIPAVDGASVDNTLPLANGSDATSLSIEGARADRASYQVRYHTVDATHFQTLGIRVTRGRTLEPGAAAGSLEHGASEVVVSETATRQIWGGRSPLNESVLLPSGDGLTGGVTRALVVGVVGDVQYDRPGTAMRPDVYVSARVDPPAEAYLLLHTRDDVRRVVAELARVVRGVDPRALVYDVMPLSEWLGRATSGTRYVSAILVFYAALALGIALLGVHTLVAYHVALRTREFGIMRAIGAPTRSIVLDVARRGLTITLAGVALGLLATSLSTRLLRSQVFGVGVYESKLLAGCVLLFVVVAVLGSLLPTLRAVRVEPATALATA